MSDDPRSRALSALSKFLVTEGSLGDTLLRVSAIATEAMPAADMAGVTLLGEDGQPTTDVYTHEDAPAIDAAQYATGNGPCLDAWRTKRIVLVRDMDEAREDYPEFSAACRDHGVMSTISLPLVASDQGVGALNLYAAERNGFTEDDIDMGHDLAAAAGVVLANSAAYWSAYEHSANMAEAMRTRATIEQAKGMLMARSPDLSADDAFELLRKASMREHRKLRDIAQRIVDRETPSGPGE